MDSWWQRRISVPRHARHRWRILPHRVYWRAAIKYISNWNGIPREVHGLTADFDAMVAEQSSESAAGLVVVPHRFVLAPAGVVVCRRCCMVDWVALALAE